MHHRLRAFALLTTTVCASCGGGPGGGTSDDPPLPFLVLSSFQPATVVVGQLAPTAGSPDAGGGSPNEVGLRFPVGAAAGGLFVPDTQNHRVLGFAGVPQADGAAAAFVLGQPGFTSGSPGTSASQFRLPYKVVVAGGRLFLADLGNHRVLIWDRVPTSNAPADHVVGQSNFTNDQPNDDDQDGTPDAAPSARTLSAPSGLAVADGRLYVADQNNHRVLIWDSIPTSNGVPADRVLGQVDFLSNGPGTSDGMFRFPTDVAVGGGRLFVADSTNHRVLVWNSTPPAFPIADLVLGQADFVSSLPGATATGMVYPIAVHASGTQLFVADYGNNRVLVYDTLPVVVQQAADHVLGQSTFTHVAPNDDDQDGVPDASPSGRTLRGPSGLAGNGKLLFVTDENHRVVILESP